MTGYIALSTCVALVDLCEFNNDVIIYYSWGNQLGTEHLAEAVYRGTLQSFLRGFFPTREDSD